MSARLRFHPDRVPEGLLGLMLLGSALAIGAVHPPVAAALGVAAVLFAAWVWLFDRARPARPPLLVAALLAAGVWALVQSLPLGAAVASLSPQAAAAWAGAGLEPHFSANLPATRLMAVKCLAGAVFLAGASHYMRRPERAIYVADLIVVVSCVVAAVGFVQGALRVDRVLFLYEPQMGPVRAGLRGPFVNPDHFAAFMAVGALVALSRSLALDLNRRRFLYDVAAAALVGAGSLSLSLSGLLGLAAGLLALVVLWWRHHGRPADALAVILPVLALGGGLFFAGVLFGAVADPWSTLRNEWAQVRSLPDVWAAATGLIEEAPLVGLGSGSLTDRLGAAPDAPAVSFWYARNQVVQALVDFGLVAGGLLVIALVLCLGPLLRRWSTERLAAALPFLVPLVGLAALSLLDFALEIPAIGLLAAVLAAGAVAQARRRSGDDDAPDPDGRAPRARRRRGWLIPVGASLALAAVAFSVWTSQEFGRAVQRLSVLAQAAPQPPSDPTSAAGLDDAARAVLGFRPGWGRIYTTVGQAWLELAQPERAVPWLDGAAARLPNDAVTLRALGVAHLRLGDGARGTEWLRRSAGSDRDAMEAAIRLVLEESDDLDVWLALATDDAAQQRLTQELLARGRAVDALRLGLVLLDRDPDSHVGLAAAAEAALRLELVEQATGHTRRLLAVAPEHPLGESLMARLLVRSGDAGAAIDRAEAALVHHPETAALWFALGEAVTAALESAPRPDPELEARMRQVRDHLRPIALVDPLLAGDFHRLSARYYRATASWRAAASAAVLGIEASGPAADLYEILGIARAELGDVAGASTALRTALQLDPGRGDARQALESLTPGNGPRPPTPIDGTPPPATEPRGPAPTTQEGSE